MLTSSQGLARNPTGDYTISLPAELLPPGRCTINVYARENGKLIKVESYRIQINRVRR